VTKAHVSPAPPATTWLHQQQHGVLRCQNNHKQSSGQNTWVACHWNVPKKCYVLPTGQGQADWFKLSHDGPLKCLQGEALDPA
jgi:hypothetical protein